MLVGLAIAGAAIVCLLVVAYLDRDPPSSHIADQPDADKRGFTPPPPHPPPAPVEHDHHYGGSPVIHMLLRSWDQISARMAGLEKRSRKTELLAMLCVICTGIIAADTIGWDRVARILRALL